MCVFEWVKMFLEICYFILTISWFFKIHSHRWLRKIIVLEKSNNILPLKCCLVENTQFSTTLRLISARKMDFLSTQNSWRRKNHKSPSVFLSNLVSLSRRWSNTTVPSTMKSSDLMVRESTVSFRCGKAQNIARKSQITRCEHRHYGLS